MKPAASEGASQDAFSVFGYFAVLLSASRPHFFAFPVGAILAGLSTSAFPPSTVRITLACLIAGVGWGIGQLLNDVLDLEADSIDAPERPAVRGLLPPRLTISLATAIGLILVAILIQLHPFGWLLGLCSMALILSYNKCKAIPGVGNLSHGLLMSVACLIGAAVAQPKAPLDVLIQTNGSSLFFTGAWAALYLQSNYEKDMRGDAVGGYRTLAHVLGLRASALMRAGIAVSVGAVALRQMSEFLPMAQLAVAAGLIVFSSLRVAQDNTMAGALRGYRASVHGGTLGMVAFGAGVLPPLVFCGISLIAVLLTEAAFRRTTNP